MNLISTLKKIHRLKIQQKNIKLGIFAVTKWRENKMPRSRKIRQKNRNCWQIETAAYTGQSSQLCWTRLKLTGQRKYSTLNPRTSLTIQWMRRKKVLGYPQVYGTVYICSSQCSNFISFFYNLNLVCSMGVYFQLCGEATYLIKSYLRIAHTPSP